MLPFYKVSAWVFLIHMFLYAGFYCIPENWKNGAVYVLYIVYIVSN